MKYTEKDLRKHLGQNICVSGKYHSQRQYIPFSFTGKLVQYGFKKYGIEYTDRHGQQQLGTFKLSGIEHIIEVC